MLLQWQKNLELQWEVKISPTKKQKVILYLETLLKLFLNKTREKFEA